MSHLDFNVDSEKEVGSKTLVWHFVRALPTHDCEIAMTVPAGLVVSLRQGGTGMVLLVDKDLAWVVPITGEAGLPRHRSEVRLCPDEAEACGVGLKYPTFRCHLAFRAPIAALATYDVRGRGSPDLLNRVMRALRTEAQRQEMEQRLQFARHGDERCVAMT